MNAPSRLTRRLGPGTKVSGGAAPSAAGLLVALGVAACGQAPDDPTWVEHVAPMLRANCLRCHDAPAAGQASGSTGRGPPSFRLDVFDNVYDGRSIVRGAAALAPFVVARAARMRDMPLAPAHELSPVQQDTLERWGAPVSIGLWRLPAKGTRAVNHDPTLELLAPIDGTSIAGPLEIAMRIEDADQDTVLGEIRATGPLGPGQQFPYTVIAGNGVQRPSWDPAGLADGTYHLRAVFAEEWKRPTDPQPDPAGTPNPYRTPPLAGADAQAVDLGTVTVASAPPLVTARIITDEAAPRGTAVVRKGESAFVEVRIIPSGPTPQTLIVEAQREPNVVLPIAIVPKAAIVVPTTRVPWSAIAAEPGDGWRVRARVADGRATGVGVSAPFVVSDAPPGPAFVNVAPLLHTHCATCHGGVDWPKALVPSAPWVFDGATIDCGAAERAKGAACVSDVLEGLYRRVVDARSMPPPSARAFGAAPMPEAARNQIAAWLAGGAQR